MKRFLTAFILFFACSLMAQPQPILRNAMTTNIAGTPVLSRSDLSVTNVGSGTNWLFYGTSPRTVARLVDIALGAGTLWATVVSNSDGSITVYTNTANVGTNIYGLTIGVLTNANTFGTNRPGTPGQVFTTDGGYTYWANAGAGDVTTAQLNSASNSLQTSMSNTVGYVSNILISYDLYSSNKAHLDLTNLMVYVSNQTHLDITNLNVATSNSLQTSMSNTVGYVSNILMQYDLASSNKAHLDLTNLTVLVSNNMHLDLTNLTTYVSNQIHLDITNLNAATSNSLQTSMSNTVNYASNILMLYDLASSNKAHLDLTNLTVLVSNNMHLDLTNLTVLVSNATHLDMTNLVNNAASNRVVVVAGANVTVATNSPAANVMSYTVASTGGGSGAPFATVVSNANGTVTIYTNASVTGTNIYGLAVSDPLTLTAMNVQDFTFTNVTGTFTNANNFGTNKPGVAGQFLTSDGGYLYWSTIDQSFGQAWFVWGSSNTLATNSSGVAYKAMQKSDVTLPATPNTNTYTTPTAGQYIGEVITAIPAGVTAILPGDIDTVSFIYLSENRTMVLQPEIYLRTNMIAPSWSALGELEIGAGPQFTVNNVFTPYTIAVTITTNVPMSVTNYLVRKYKVISVSGGTPNALFVSQGQYPARVTFPIGSSSFVLKSGDTMSGNLVVNASIGINTNATASAFHVLANPSQTNLIVAGLTTGDYKFVVSTNGDIMVNFNSVPAELSLIGTAISARGADNAQVRLAYSSYGAAGLGAFAGRHARGTAGSKSAVQAGDVLISLEGWGYGATTYSASPRAFIRGYAGGTWTDATQPAYISLWTCDAGGIVPVERIRINTNGTVGFATNSPQEVLHVNGSGRFQTNVVTMWDGAHYGSGLGLTNLVGLSTVKAGTSVTIVTNTVNGTNEYTINSTASGSGLTNIVDEYGYASIVTNATVYGIQTNRVPTTGLQFVISTNAADGVPVAPPFIITNNQVGIRTQPTGINAFSVNGAVNFNSTLAIGGTSVLDFNGTTRLTVPEAGTFKIGEFASATRGYKDKMYINNLAKVLTDATAVPLFYIGTANNAGGTNSFCGGTIDYTIYCTDNTDSQSLSGVVTYSGINPGGVWTSTITEVAANQAKAVTSGTLTTAWTMTPRTSFESTNILVEVNADTSLTPAANKFYIFWQLRSDATNSIVVQ